MVTLLGAPSRAELVFSKRLLAAATLSWAASEYATMHGAPPCILHLTPQVRGNLELFVLGTLSSLKLRPPSSTT